LRRLTSRVWRHACRDLTDDLRPLRSTYEAFLHAAGMVQTRTFRIDALDLATGAPLSGNGTISSSSAPSTAAAPSSEPAHRGKIQTAPSAPLANVLRLRKLSSRVQDASKARDGLAGDGAAEQQRYLVPVIDMANHSTLAAGVNAELRLRAGSSGLRFALFSSEPSGCAVRLINAGSLATGSTALQEPSSFHSTLES